MIGDLNTDCMLLIFKHLDLVDLLNMMEVNMKFREFTLNVFSHRYENREYVVRMNFSLPDPLPQPQSNVKIRNIVSRFLNFFGMANEKKGDKIPLYFENGSKIELKDYGIIVKIIKLTMPIRKLTLTYVYPNNLRGRLEFIGELISNYSENILEIEFCFDGHNYLKHFKKPLINTKSVIIRKEFAAYRPRLPINELFPAISRLHLDFYRGISRYFNCYMPNLEHLQISRAPYISFNDEMYPLINVIKENPQIRSIDLYKPQPGMLYFTSIWLKHLENLTIHKFYLPILNETFAGMEFFRFHNVKKFSMKHNSSSPRYLHFTKLEEIHLSSLTLDRIEAWFNFLFEHKSLKRFHLKHLDINDQHFERLTVHLSNLEEMSISYRQRSVISIDIIINFVKNHKKLKQFQLMTCTTTDKVTLQQTFTKKWTIKTIDDGILMQRK